MAQETAGWRREFCGYLAGNIGKGVLIGELVQRFSPLIPLHHATRLWVNKHTLHSALNMPARMRRSCILSELRHYPLVWDPPRHRQPITDHDLIVPQGRVCPGCDAVFFAALITHTCGRPCVKAARLRAKALQATGGNDATRDPCISGVQAG